MYLCIRKCMCMCLCISLCIPYSFFWVQYAMWQHPNFDNTPWRLHPPPQIPFQAEHCILKNLERRVLVLGQDFFGEGRDKKVGIYIGNYIYI